MKLMRYGPFGSEKPALVDAQGVIRDLSGVLSDIVPATLSPHSLQSLREIDPASLQALGLWLDVNGQRAQTGHTSTMVIGVAQLVSYISRFMTLNPGDLITTGTPPGVGLGRKPPSFLRAGDTMRLGIDGLGEQYQTVHAWDASPLHG